jgi:protease-4
MTDTPQSPQSSMPAPFQDPLQQAARKKGWSPLAIVLGLSGLFFLIFLIVSGVMFFSHGSNGGGSSAGSKGIFGNGSVGVIELSGVITDSKKFIHRLEQFEDEDDIKAIVIHLNSPGGAVAPSQEIYQAVKKSKKPVIASMSSVAASGAYYVACAAKKVYANPGTITGSIGVIMEFLNLSKLYEWAKVQRYSIKTGKFKDEGAEYRDMTPDERALLQGMVDDVLTQFKEAVSEGRKIPLDQVTAIADGRIFSGNQAKKAKLVDELGTLQDAIDDAAKQGGIKGKPNVIYPMKPRRGVMDLISDASGGGGDSDDDSQSSVGSANTLANGLSRGGWVGVIEQLLHAPTQADTAVTNPGIYWLWMGR